MSPLLSFMTKLLNESYSLLADCSDNDRFHQPGFERQYTRWVTSGRQVLVHAGLETFLSDTHARWWCLIRWCHGCASRAGPSTAGRVVCLSRLTQPWHRRIGHPSRVRV